MEVLEELVVMYFFVTACFLVTIISSFLRMTASSLSFSALNELPSSQVLLFPISFFFFLLQL